MVSTGVIILKKAGHNIPDKYLEMVLKANQGCIGAATSERATKITTISGNESPDLESLNVTQKEFTNDNVLYYFNNEERNELDLQPYVLVKDKEDNAVLVGFLEGDFSDFIHATSAYSPEYFAVNEYLIPKLQAMYDLVGGDMVKFIAALDTPMVKREMLSTFKERGTVVTLALNGVVMSWEKNELRADFPWGWTSDRMDYAEEAVAAEGVQPTTATPRKFTVANFRKTAKAAVQSILPKPAEPTPEPAPASKPVEAPAPAHTPGKKKAVTNAAPVAALATPTPKPAIQPAAPQPVVPKELPNGTVIIPHQPLTDEEKLYTPPANVQGNEKLKSAYRHGAGFLPGNWLERPTVTKSPKKQKDIQRAKKHEARIAVARSLQDIGPALAAAKTATAIPATAGKKASVTLPPENAVGDALKAGEFPVIDTAAHHIPEEIPIMSAAQMKDLSKFLSDGKVIKAIDKHSKIILDPKLLQDLEAKTLSFSEVSGLDLEEVLNWPHAVRMMLVKDHQTAASMLIGELAYHYTQMLKAEKIEDEEDDAVEEIIPAAPQKPVSVPSTGKKKAVAM